MSDQLSNQAQQALADMFKDLEGVDVDGIKTDGITIRTGNKLVKLEVVLEEDVSIEDEIREEFRIKLRDKLQEIKNRLNVKITEMVELTTRVRMEAEDKEKKLKEELRRSQPMPEITWAHGKKGISVVKGRGSGELIWLVRGIYAPKFVDQKPIEPKYAKKLITNVVFLIRTSGTKITEVSTRKPHGLGYFSHYHQQSPDCWGNWSYPREWKSIDHLVAIAREAEAVLENVNTGSIATQAPRGLPRRQTLERHIETSSQTRKRKSLGDTGPELDTDAVRAGVGTLRDNGDVWTA